MPLSNELTTPPDWDDHYNQSLRHPRPFLNLKVDPGSKEFQVLEDLIGPGACTINEIHRVVNPALWRRFLVTRKELICTKSNDVGILGFLGMEGDEIANRTASLPLNPHLDQYVDNVALLFHCTRKGTDVDAILSQGLDDRLAEGGSYGRGIYFADDPVKSLNYDGTGGTLFIFAVHLGDCCLAPGGSIIREPEKANTQKRNQMDLFFDSVLGGLGGYNEYVIFSRHQCCPLYMVSCRKGVTVHYDSALRKKPPPFVWIGNPSLPNTGNHPSSSWPFFAKLSEGKVKVTGGMSVNVTGIMAPNNKKGLYLYKTLKELINSTDTPALHRTVTSGQILFNSAERLVTEARKAFKFKTGDEEQAYILYMRAASLYMKVKECPTVQKDPKDLTYYLHIMKANLLESIDTAETLKRSLRTRYAKSHNRLSVSRHQRHKEIGAQKG